MLTLQELKSLPRLQILWQQELPEFVQTLRFSPNDPWVSVTTGREEVTVFELSSGKIVSQFHAKGHAVLTQLWSPDGQKFVTGGQDGMIRLWNVHSSECLAVLKGGSVWVEHLAWQPQSQIWASASGAHLKLWNAQGDLIQEMEKHPYTIQGLAWQPNGAKLASISYGGLRLWKPSESQVHRFFAWKDALLVVRWSPDGQYLACGCQGGAVHVWHVNSGRDLEMTGYATKLRELAWDSQSRWLSTGGGSEITTWKFSGKGPAGTKPKIGEGHLDQIVAMEFHPKHPVLATGGKDGAVFLWNHEQPIPMYGAFQQSAVSCLAWCNKQPIVLVGYASGAVIAWKIEGGLH